MLFFGETDTWGGKRGETGRKRSREQQGEEGGERKKKEMLCNYMNMFSLHIRTHTHTHTHTPQPTSRLYVSFGLEEVCGMRRRRRRRRIGGLDILSLSVQPEHK